MSDNILEQAASIVAQSETDNGALPLSTVHQYLMQKAYNVFLTKGYHVPYK
jgi:hypothetical protein